MSDLPPRIILRDGITSDDIDRSVAELGYQLVNIIPPSEIHPAQSIFAASAHQGTLFVIQDGRLGLSYLTGVGETAADDLERLRSSLPCYDEEEIWMHLSSPVEEELVGALGLLVLSAPPEPTDRHVAALSGALCHRSAQIRLRALLCASYVPWPALRGAIEALAHDEDVAVRFHAQQVIERLYPAASEGP